MSKKAKGELNEEIYEELFNKIDELRELLVNNVQTRNKKISKKSDLSKNKEIDNCYDIDIFFSRKPGMRRSIQFISSNAESPEDARVSVMVAIASLLDTIVAQQDKLGVSPDDICNVFAAWINNNVFNKKWKL